MSFLNLFVILKSRTQCNDVLVHAFLIWGADWSKCGGGGLERVKGEHFSQSKLAVYDEPFLII